MTGPATRSPRPWLAAILALLFGPWGALYTSNVLAILVLLTYLVLLTLVGLPQATRGIIAALLAGASAFTWARFSLSKRLPSGLCRIDYFRLPQALVLGALIYGVLLLFTRTTFTVLTYGGYSMAPALLYGDQVSAVLAPVLRGEVSRGNLVSFKFPGENAPNTTIISRVVGVVGDKVEVRRGVLLVNGEVADIPAAFSALRAAGCVDEKLFFNNRAVIGAVGNFVEGEDTQAVPVPISSVAVISDNRSDLFPDSRSFGFLPLSEIRSVVIAPHSRHEALRPEDCLLPAEQRR